MEPVAEAQLAGFINEEDVTDGIGFIVTFTGTRIPSHRVAVETWLT